MSRKDFLPSIFQDFADLDRFFRHPILKGNQEHSGVSVYEDEGHIYVEANVPGLKPEEIDISVDNHTLWIKGATQEEKKDVKYHMKSEKSFSYGVRLPEGYDETQSPQATCKDGVLKVKFAKSKVSKPQKIEIKSE